MVSPTVLRDFEEGRASPKLNRSKTIQLMRASFSLASNSAQNRPWFSYWAFGRLQKGLSRSIHSDSLSRGGGISERSAKARTSASSMTLGARDQIVKRCLIVDAVVGLQRSRHALDREPVPLDQRGNFLL